MKFNRKLAPLALLVTALALFAACAAGVSSAPANTAIDSHSVLQLANTVSSPDATAPAATELATAPEVSVTPSSPQASPTIAPPATPLPCDFMKADFTKSPNAGILEHMFVNWGFSYYKPDGKWTPDDTYELTLFQRWAKLSPSGAFDNKTRSALQSAYLQYASTIIPRSKLPLEGKYIGINAGHQQKADPRKEPLSPEKNSPQKARVSSGTQGFVTRVPEYKVTLLVALKLRVSLQAQGARVLMVRTTNDVRISNVERCKMMNAAQVDVYISLHCDGNTNHKIHGLHTLIPADRGYQHGAVLTKSQQFANLIQQEAIKATGAANKGFSTRRDLSSFNWSKMPTCLVEMGFMTYPAEDKLLNSAKYQDKIVQGFTTGFLRYFKEVK